MDFPMREQDAIFFKIERVQAIELDRLTLGMMALGNEYQRYVRSKYPEAEDQETDLLVRRITDGSIIIELTGALQPLFNGMENILVFRDFTTLLGWKIEQLSAPKGRLDEATVREVRDICRLAETVATDPNGRADLTAEYYSNDGQREVAAKLTINSRQAALVRENAAAQISSMTGETSDVHCGVLMRLYQTNLSEPSHDRSSGEKGIIEALADTPRRLIYASEMAAQRIKGAWSEPGVSPYELGFTVDVDVQRVNGKPRAYRIMNVHDIFPIDDD